MRNSDQISSLFWFITGIGVTLLSIKYDFGTFLSPGAGFVTFFAGLILSLLSLILFISSWRTREPHKRLKELWEGLDWIKVIYVVSLLVVYTLILKSLGFLISTFLLLTLLFRAKGSYPWLRVTLLSLFITTGAFLIFQIWLKVQLPKGILEGII
jgi:putative tricarboxylic transport membrane protein